MYEDYDSDELEGEITVEEVMLRSLDKVDGEHVEKEKRELKEKISEMKNLLDMRRNGKIDQTLPESHRASKTETASQPAPSRSYFKHGNNPSSDGVKTPVRARSGVASDMASSESPTYSMPSRKRNGSTTTPEGTSRREKVQRVTPPQEIEAKVPDSHQSTTSSWTNGSKEDPIDLTELKGSDESNDEKFLINEAEAKSRALLSETPTREPWQRGFGQQHSFGKGPPKSEPSRQAPPQKGTPSGSQQVKKERDSPTIRSESHFTQGRSATPVKHEFKPRTSMPGSWNNDWTSQGSHGPSHTMPAAHQGGSLRDITNRTSAFSLPGQSIKDVMDQGLSTSASYERAVDAVTSAMNPGERDKAIDQLLLHIQSKMTQEDRALGKSPTELIPALYPHQIVALSWMRKMENGTNKGGILADDMGLGKTVSTISLILANRSADKFKKTTLIVAPLALLHQWMREIDTKIRPTGPKTAVIHHGSKSRVEDLLKRDFVLTTYGTLGAEWSRLEKHKEEHEGRRIDWTDSSMGSRFPLLHPKAQWYRVVLDEAQCIKNRKTRAAKSAYALKSRFRWCLTGTPMMNGVEELYSPLCFLRIKPYCHWGEFSKKFGRLSGKAGDPKSQAMEALRALLNATTLRRSKKTKINGQPIIQLPAKSEEQIHVKLSQDERDFYKQLEEKAQVQFNKYLRAGSVGKHYAAILAQLLRMRQACCHPHLNLDVEDPVATNPGMEAAAKGLKSDVVESIKNLDAFVCSICSDSTQDPSFFAPCGDYGCNGCLLNVVSEWDQRNLRAGEVDDEGRPTRAAECPTCQSLVDINNMFTYTAFQTVHMPEKLQERQESEPKLTERIDDTSEESGDAAHDREDADADEYGNLEGFVVHDSYYDTDDEGRERQKQKAEEHRKRREARQNLERSKKAGEELGNTALTHIKPSMLRELRQHSSKNPRAYKKYFDYLQHTWQPSAKVTACIELLKKLQDLREKTIVFSQWTLLLDLIEVAMKRERLTRPQRYDGSMNPSQRDGALGQFRDNMNIKVILVSLKAGNAGLNLTAASRVIIMDPFWNPYIEMQAIDRTYRIGQDREVKVYRILTEETVEDRIVALQERKKEIIESALDEDKALEISKLKPAELKGLLFDG